MKYGERNSQVDEKVPTQKELLHLASAHTSPWGCFYSSQRSHCNCSPQTSEDLRLCCDEREIKRPHRHRSYCHGVGPSNTLIPPWLKALLQVIKINLRYTPCSINTSQFHELGAVAAHVSIPTASGRPNKS